MDAPAPLAVVTGASRGIGRVVAERLAATGFTVVAVGRSAELLREVAAASGAVPLVLDVSDAAAVAEAWALIESTYGVPTLLVNNAGVAGPSGMSWELEPTAWWSVFETNVLGTYLVTRAALPSMLERGSGRIVNVSSNAAFFPIGDDNDGVINSAYMASKAAVIRFTEAVAGETAARGVQVFATSPGTVKTDMTVEIFAEDWDDPELWSPPELTADFVEYVTTGALDALSGRYLHAARDDWRALGVSSMDVLANDTHALRVRTS
jgi:3-oxoacyl-[acyl-carrier protein] reductase